MMKVYASGYGMIQAYVLFGSKFSLPRNSIIYEFCSRLDVDKIMVNNTVT